MTNDSNHSSNDVPFAINRLHRNIINNDTSHTSAHQLPEIENNNIHNFDQYIVNGFRIVSKMPLDIFKQCLVNHFHIQFKMNTVFWPKHMNSQPSKI